MIALLPLSVMMPLLGAGLALLLSRRPRAQRAVAISVLAVQLVLEVVMLVQIDADGPIVMHIGGWPAPLAITLVADRLAALMMVVSTLVTLAVLVYAVAQGHADGEATDAPISVFHPAFLIMAAGVSNAFVAGDLFNLYVSFEILLTASYVLLTLGGTMERIRSGAPYVVVALVSSIIFLSAIAMIYAATGTLNMADLAGRLADLPAGLAVVLQSMLLIAFGVKAAVWPMSAWLPDSYPTASAPVTAVFAGLLTKVGIYAIIRTQTLLFPGGFSTLLMIVGLATMLIGILGAVAQNEIKRLLSFTLVSHIGFLLFGVAIGTPQGLAATVFYVAHHILVQTALFLAAGLIEHITGTTKLDKLGALARTAPALAILFFIPAMNLGGVPPFSGFIGKVGLFEAGLATGGVTALVLVAGGALTSLLTLYAIVRVWGRAFWRPAPAREHDGMAGLPVGPSAAGERSDRERPAGRRRRRRLPQEIETRGDARSMPVGMVGATLAVVLAGLALTVAAGPIYGFADRAAQGLSNPSVYITAVLGAS
ncbi:Na+/H+ antiporter subunit D [Nakamurella lactea]|uniref:Na+/H+ antiporter subunit D n=1 Tax=Nakamurella lactea TaxID=459515 RepID=UPI000409AA68|nr:Na+/H+ antiporter subunit D [Nakamurella lactea]